MKRIIYTLVAFFCFTSLQGQNVGIGTNNPTEKLHLRSDSSVLAIRFDHKKSTEGFELQSSIGLATSANQTTFDSRKADWTDFNVSKSQTSNDVYLNGPFIDTATVVTNTYSIDLGFADPIPSDAIIQSIQVKFEWKLQGPEGAFVHVYPKLYNGDDYLVSYQRQDITSLEDEIYQSHGIVIDTTLYSNLSIADINAGNLRIEMSGYHLHYIYNEDSVRVRFDEISLLIEYEIPAAGNENVYWSEGVKEGKYIVANGTNLDGKNYLSINENGLTRLKELQITKGAGAGKLLTCNVDGIAYWQSPEDLGLDKSETNELQELQIGANKLGIVRVDEQEDSTYRYIHSFVELDSLNYWQKNGLDVYVDTGFVGIQVLNPKAPLHMRQDSQDVYIRFDNRKSEITGTIDSSSIGLPSSVENVNSSFTDWTNLNVSDLLSDDDIYLQSPVMNLVEFADNLKIGFDFADPIPMNATITDVKINVEWKITSQLATDYFHNRALFLYNGNAGQITHQFLGNSMLNVDNQIDEIHSDYGAIYPLFFPLTPAQLNSGDVNLQIYLPHTHFGGAGRLKIDRISLKVEYTMPATGTENVSWAAGVKDGKFKISNDNQLDDNNYLSIDERGVTRVQALKITEDAGPGKVLTSNDFGRASWQDPPSLFNDDTLLITALAFDDGMALLSNSSDILQTERQWMNILIDTDDDQPSAHFALFTNVAESNGQPKVNFNLDDGDSWIKSGDLGLGLIDPQADFHILHGNDVGLDGFRMENNSTSKFWRFFVGELGNLSLWSTDGGGVNVGSFNGTSGAYFATSDRRMKKNIQPLKKVLDRVLRLDTKKYHFKSQLDDQPRSIGLIAQDVNELFPEAVHYDPDMDTYKMDYSVFGVLAIKAIQEQQSEITTLKDQIGELIERVMKLEK